MTIDEAFALYDMQLVADGRSPHTRGQYRRHINLLAGFFRELRIEDITHVDLARFLASSAATDRADGGKKKATSVNALRSTVRSFWGYLAAARVVPSNAAWLVRRARCGSAPPRALACADVGRLRAALAHATSKAERRDRVLIEFLLGTGCRIGASLAIRVDDVDFDACEVVLREMKGDRPAVVRLAPEVRDRLREHVGIRERGYVFENAAGERLGPRQASRRLEIWCERAGIRAPVSPHRLRHTFAIWLYSRTRDLLAVQAALHHRSIASTVVYAGSR